MTDGTSASRTPRADWMPNAINSPGRGQCHRSLSAGVPVIEVTHGMAWAAHRFNYGFRRELQAGS